MSTRYMLGNEAIAHACIEADIDFASGYPGTPSSEVIDVLRTQKEREFYVEWSVNEKVAVENALGAAWTGVRSLATMKHVGLNVAADPLMTSGYTGVTGGMLILSADDPYAHSSQNEQDSRNYAKFARIPCFDPSNVQEAHDMVISAYKFSEEFKVPVLYRPTTRICHSKSNVELGEAGTNHRCGEFEKNPQQYVVIPVHTRVLHKKLNAKQIPMAKRLVELGFNYTNYVSGAEAAVIAGGAGAEYVKELLPKEVSFAKIGAYPIDTEWLREFVAKHKKVLVVEELFPVIEEAVLMVSGDSTEVFGKISGGCIPYEGELDLRLTAKGFDAAGIPRRSILPPAEPVQNLPSRPPVLCAGCGHRAVFYAMRRVFGKDAVFTSDIGCYTLGIQLGTVDTTICMGASITIGSGIANAGNKAPVVSTIGDSTFLHTGIQGLINAVYNNADQTIVILDNRITAMTGHQPNPNTGVRADGEPSVSISLESICRACGASFVETVDAYDFTILMSTLKKAKETEGVKVIIARQPCVIAGRRAGIKRKPMQINADACIGCGGCVKFGCPAVEFIDGKASINELCSGCGVCAEICPKGAVIKSGGN